MGRAEDRDRRVVCQRTVEPNPSATPVCIVIAVFAPPIRLSVVGVRVRAEMRAVSVRSISVAPNAIAESNVHLTPLVRLLVPAPIWGESVVK